MFFADGRVWRTPEEEEELCMYILFDKIHCSVAILYPLLLPNISAVK
jgi:hypothetical protein